MCQRGPQAAPTAQTARKSLSKRVPASKAISPCIAKAAYFVRATAAVCHLARSAIKYTPSIISPCTSTRTDCTSEVRARESRPAHATTCRTAVRAADYTRTRLPKFPHSLSRRPGRAAAFRAYLARCCPYIASRGPTNTSQGARPAHFWPRSGHYNAHGVA